MCIRTIHTVFWWISDQQQLPLTIYFYFSQYNIVIVRYLCVKYFHNKSYRVMWSHLREIDFRSFTIFRNLLLSPEVLWCSGALVFYYVIRVHTKIRIDSDAFSERPSWHKPVFCVETRTVFRNMAFRDNEKMRSYIAKEGAIEGLVVFRLQNLKFMR